MKKCWIFVFGMFVFCSGAAHAEQVGVIGYSAGGETALILAGAEPDLDRLRRWQPGLWCRC